MAGCSSKSAPEDPEYIEFLLDPKMKFSCYFVVGNKDQAAVEKIGVVRKMLAAHSEVFRSQLLDMKWKCEKPDHINDIFPATFKNLLRYVYGHDTTATMTFDDADDLFYAADRYIMPRFKNKLATRLITLLDYTNICSLLVNPACARALELQSEINKVIQLQTDKILAHPQFLNCCPDTFVKILEQEALNVPELELWRAALKWAKNRVKSENRELLRKQLEKPLQLVRICTIPEESYEAEVVPTGVLTEEEAAGIVDTRLSAENSPALTTICAKTNPRKQPQPHTKFRTIWYKVSEEKHAELRGIGWAGLCSKEMSLTLETDMSPVKIDTLICFIYDEGFNEEYNFTVTIRAVGSTESVVVHSKHQTGGYENLPITVSTVEREVVLAADTKYEIIIASDCDFYNYIHKDGVIKLQDFMCVLDCTGNSRYASAVADILYKTLTPC